MKLQPNFSWQKYETKPENFIEQFQYQLQTEHIQVANSVNATIDDLSFFTRERQTSFAWVNGKPIWKKTLATVTWGGGGTTNTIPMSIALKPGETLNIIRFEATISNGTNTFPLPYIDVAVAANSIQLARVGTNIVITSGGTNYSTYSGYVTIYYTKE